MDNPINFPVGCVRDPNFIWDVHTNMKTAKYSECPMLSHQNNTTSGNSNVFF